MNAFSKSLIVSVVSVSIANAAVAQEWTRFRGPNGSGVSDASTVPALWKNEELNWKVKLPGIGHSSPVVWGNKVFIQSADADSAKQYLICLDATTGKTNWQREFEIGSYHIHARNSFASVTPAVDADRVYFAWATPDQTTFVAYDHAGEPVWEKKLGSFASSHGFGTSPIVYGDLVILCHQQKTTNRDEGVTPTSSIFAFNRETGGEVWKSARKSDKASYSVPCILRQVDRPDELIVCSTSDGILSLDPKSGEENWTRKVFSMRTVSSPNVADGLIFGSTGSGAGGNYVVALKAGPIPEVAYEVKRQAPYVPTSVAHQGLAYLWSDDGIVTCIDVRSGEQHWQKRVGGNYSSSPIIVGERLYCVSEEGDVVVLAAAKQYQLLGKNSLGEESRSTPAVANGRMYLRTYSHLMSVGGPGST